MFYFSSSAHASSAHASSVHAYHHTDIAVAILALAGVLENDRDTPITLCHFTKA
jgi:hypothetical protein